MQEWLSAMIVQMKPIQGWFLAKEYRLFECMEVMCLITVFTKTVSYLLQYLKRAPRFWDYSFSSVLSWNTENKNIHDIMQQIPVYFSIFFHGYDP